MKSNKLMMKINKDNYSPFKKMPKLKILLEFLSLIFSKLLKVVIPTPIFISIYLHTTTIIIGFLEEHTYPFKKIFERG
jgi:hypothetical protein